MSRESSLNPRKKETRLIFSFKSIGDPRKMLMFSHIGKISTGSSFVFRNLWAVKERMDSKIDCIFYEHEIDSGETLTKEHENWKNISSDPDLEAVWTKKKN